MQISGIILCEGETDQALIGYYLMKVRNWKYVRRPKDAPFPDEVIAWYVHEDGYYMGIWSIGGNDFTSSIALLMEREHMDHEIDKIAIVTDHDDEQAESDRFFEICEIISDTCSVEFHPEQAQFNNQEWIDVSFKNAFGEVNVVHFAYILVPENEYGALETYMLQSLADSDHDKRKVIDQARHFVKHLESDVYLRKRRERIKAELGVSVSVFSPDRVFTTMDELIRSVSWEEFDRTHSQFAILKEI